MCHPQTILYYEKTLAEANKTEVRLLIWITLDDVMHQSIPAVPIPPPWANPRALAFLKKLGEFPRVGTKKEGKCPAPGMVAFLQFCSFFINQWIKRSTFQYFNAMVLKTSRTTLCASLFWLYFFLYILFSTKFKTKFLILSIFLIFTLLLYKRMKTI